MKYCWFGFLLAIAAFRAQAFAVQGGCNLKLAHAITGQLGGAIDNAAQAHLVVRANMLEADLSNAVKAGVLTHQQARQKWDEVDNIRQQALASKKAIAPHQLKWFDDKLDGITKYLCHR